MITIKLTGSGGVSGPKVTFANSMQSLLRVQDMQKIADFGLQAVKARAMRGLGSDDSPMPALKAKRISRFKVNGKDSARSVGYAAWKGAHGMQPTRDLVGDGSQGGHMMDNLSVRSITETTVKIALTKKHQREKALANEKIASWLKWSPSNQRDIAAFAGKVFGVAVKQIDFFKALSVFRKAA